ncbi:ATP-binding protein [Oligoflexus tunisiensis]|uniref:ATP-binding protein n=1 Tax=Oligoflexus tunisiensis TaxID=708132 RepID=UPI000A3D9978|nr:ATP-binding protein [Oligoflexus tunisiensis]
MQPPGFLRNQLGEQELTKLVRQAAIFCSIMYLPFSYIYPLVLGPQTVDPFWERLVLSTIALFGLLLPRFPQTRPWIQAFIYGLCFLFSGHLFFLVCRNDLNVAYQLGYICVVALIAFYLDTNIIFCLYVLYNGLLIAASLLYKVSYDNLLFGMIIATILGIDWLALMSRLRVMKSLRESRAEVMHKNRKIQSILENIQQGVLIIEDADGRIGDECSTFLYRLMDGRNPDELRNLRQILERTQLTQDQVEQVLSVVCCIIHEDEVSFAINYHLFPRTLIEGRGQATRQLELDWNPIIDSRGRVSHILVCIRDVTELNKLRRDAARGQQEFTLLAELVNIPRERRGNALDSSANLMEQMITVREASPILLLRLLHTLKGNARTFGLLTLAQAAHDCESQIMQGQASGPEPLEPLKRLVQDYRTIAEHKLDHQSQSHHYVSLPRDQWKAAVAALDHLPSHQRQGLQALYDLVQSSRTQTFQNVLAPQLESLPPLAAELGRKAPVVHIEDPGFQLQPEGAELIHHAFLHLLRNALDHGIENPADRQKAQKPLEGHIWCILKDAHEGLEIHVQDDGRGLNLTAIEQKARVNGLIAAHEVMPPQKIAEFIFHPGFSTRDAVTEISGRGVGLDAVRAMLEQAGGGIRIVLEDVTKPDSVAFRFILRLPSQCVTPRMPLTA